MQTHIPSDTSPPSLPWADTCDQWVRRISRVVMWVNLLLVAVIIIQVVWRYGFNGGHPKLEELQWHLYAIAVMFGLSYAQVENSHIRVDVLAMHFGPRAKAFWEVVGICLFLLPFLYVVLYHSIGFVEDAWRTAERSDAPLGLPYRWLIKSVIPISFALLAVAAIARLGRAFATLKSGVQHGN